MSKNKKLAFFLFLSLRQHIHTLTHTRFTSIYVYINYLSIYLSSHIYITQQLNKSIFKNTFRIKQLIVKGKVQYQWQNILMPLRKKIVKRINLTNTVQSFHRRHQNFITDMILMSVLPTLNKVQPRHKF